MSNLGDAFLFDDNWYLESDLSVVELNEKKIHIITDYAEGIFQIKASAHPTTDYPKCKAISATATNWEPNSATQYRFTFDSLNAAQIRAVDNPNYQFEADLRGIQPPQQDLTLLDSIKKEFVKATEHLYERISTS